jgi:signal transduction histidine kinase
MILKWLGGPALVLAAWTGAAHADECGSARTMVDKAIAHYQVVGKAQAFTDFMTREWMSGDQYVTVATMDGIFKVHPVNPRLVDNPQMPLLRDSTGMLIVEEMIRSGREAPDGNWTKYTWTSTETKRQAIRQTWVKVHDGQLFMAGCHP